MIKKTPIICPECGSLVGYQEDFMFYVGPVVCRVCGWCSEPLKPIFGAGEEVTFWV